jgi:antitoxin (DNA-binding transcriptional repressor) of toxin-antitoxin stability system
MRSAQISELKERLDEVIAAVKNGETVEIREGEEALAKVTPMRIETGPMEARTDQTTVEAHIEELARQGKARQGTGRLPADFLTRPLPTATKSVLAALFEDRHSD